MEQAFVIKDLHFTYPSMKNEVIKGISFSIQEGEIFGLLGPSGAGKSTTQKILTRLLNDYQGEITYFNRNLREYTSDFYEEIGVGFEMPVHFGKLTGLENMRYFSSFYKKQADIETLMKQVGLWEYRDIKVAEYSKGMKVRLNFVRSILNDPKILFLDEVTNGLDPKNAKIIKDMIIDFKKSGKTVFLTTHLMNDVEQLCDKVGFCIDGELHEIATVRDLKLKYGKKEVRVEYKDQEGVHTQSFNMDHIGENTAFMELLKHPGLETIHSGETSMEDIFIKVTGSKLYEQTD